jgi:medium-chain acyl-[acyl-carrier-protein] hydrolase
MPAAEPLVWIVRAKPRPAARLRLFCFPYAGVGASAYRPWATALDPAIELCAVQPPGREERIGTPPFSRLDPLLDALAPAVQPLLDRPFVFFGHSLGALVGFELARRLRRLGAPEPRHLFVSGRRAPQLPIREEVLHTLPDAALKEELRRFNGTPDAALQHEELMALVLPVLRADLAIHETYVHRVEPPLGMPISAFGGEGDPEVPEANLAAWKEQTTKAFRLRLLPGDHFYLQAGRAPLLAAITEDLAPLLGR